MGLYEAGNVVQSLNVLRQAQGHADAYGLNLQFQATLALFSRESQFQGPAEVLPSLSRLRQLSSTLGDRTSIGGLHFVVSRLEALRGHCLDARRHAEIGRHVLRATNNLALRSSVELVDSALEANAGNLGRALRAARAGLELAQAGSLSVTVAGCLVNLGSIALFSGDAAGARQYVEKGLQIGDGLLVVAVSALDNLAQIALFEGDLRSTLSYIGACKQSINAQVVPCRSWSDLYHQLTRCAYYERLEDWTRILEISDECEPELARRQYKALRTTLLCAKARALAHLARFDEADAAVGAAVRTCPRGAVDPLIVIEATRGVCHTLRGQTARGHVHVERALSGCRAVGHRYHETWITRTFERITPARNQVAVTTPHRDVTDTALVLSDIAAILGAGHAIDLLAHRVTAILRSTPLGTRMTVDNESGCEFQADPTADADTTPDGTFRLTLRGSDRRAVIRVPQIENLDEISLLKSLSDVVHAAVGRTADAAAEDDEQNLWPKTTQAGPEEAIFHSPRMAELLKVALRLADTNLPILITGETGTGKEILARIIHDASRVKRGPFVPFNCASTPRELIESQLFGHRRGAFTGATDAFSGVIRSAEHGTLFLDEIGDLETGVQPKLLRFLESGEIHPVGDARPQRVTVRIVAATNADITREVAAGGFRRDLYYRIGLAPLVLPPLRERKDEIPALAALFLARHAHVVGRTGLRLGDDFIAALLLYDWPGNIRELSNEIRRVVAMADDGATLGSRDLAPDILHRWNERAAGPAGTSGALVHVRLDQTLAHAVRELEEQFIDHALASTGGRVTEAAELLGLSRKGLFLKRRRRGLVGGRTHVLP